MSVFKDEIRHIRTQLGLTQLQFARLIGLNDSGERTVRGWENGEHKPSNSRLETIRALNPEAPFKQISENPYFHFIDLFAGIGGFRLAFQNLGGSCVFSSEWDKFAQKTYFTNFGDLPEGDITQINADDIPDHDVLLGGFPCQAFSQAGLKKGFNDTRGTLFFDIQRILARKRPRMFLLENVKQLKGHDKGRTLDTIISVLTGDKDVEVPQELSEESKAALSIPLNYKVEYKVLRSCDFGIPQNRERIFIVGFDRDYYGNSIDRFDFVWPSPVGIPTRVGQILEPNSSVDPKYTISERLLAGHERRKREHRDKGNGFGFSVFSKSDSYTNTISARYYKDGSEILIDQSDVGLRPRKLTPRECARLQGYPENFIVDAVSDVQIYKQFGNSVTVPVIQAIGQKMMELNDVLEFDRGTVD